MTFRLTTRYKVNLFHEKVVILSTKIHQNQTLKQNSYFVLIANWLICLADKLVNRSNNTWNSRLNHTLAVAVLTQFPGRMEVDLVVHYHTLQVGIRSRDVYQFVGTTTHHHHPPPKER